MRIAFDLDGTLYDSVTAVLDLDNDIFRRLGYPPVSREVYRERFQSHDWTKLYRDLGVREEDIQPVIDMFVTEFDHVEPPLLIPGARSILAKVHRAVGDDGLYFVTNEPAHRVKKRFDRDGLEEHLGRVHSPFQGKAKELYELSRQLPQSPFFYVGDLVSDGESCLAARRDGAQNLRFVAILHEYSMNTRAALETFVAEHHDFAGSVDDLDEVVQLVLHR